MVEGPRDELTGNRQRVYEGGYTSEQDAWSEALEAKKRMETGRAAHAKRIRVRDFFEEWLASVEPALKPTACRNYHDNVHAYINPVIGDRWIGELTVPTLNAFYRHLHSAGRRKLDRNTAMYEYWYPRRKDRDGLGPRPADIAKACGTTIHAARAAAARFRRGRLPQERPTGLAPKSIKNVHRLLHRALKDAVAWGYLFTNPAEHAVIPREAARQKVKRQAPWTVDELGRWLKVALKDRYDGIWALVATTGMRRSELAGLSRDLLDLDSEFLAIEDTRVTVGGRATDSDGKSAAGRRGISLDAFTVKHLRRYVARIDAEREAFGSSYPAHGRLMVGPDGRQLHPDTITRRFNRLVDRAGVPRIRLHDVRHTYATLAMDAGVDPKLLSDRLGHDLTVMLQVYTHRSTGKDRDAARMMAGLIEAAVEPEPPEVS
jgi:integrase